MNALIFMEGVSGVGKSTTSAALSESLRSRGYRVRLYPEGDPDSPVDLYGVAYLTKAGYDSLLSAHPGFAKEITKNSEVWDDYALVRYRTQRDKFYSPELYEHLKAREFCCRPDRPVPFPTFRTVFENLWLRFSETADTGQDYIIADGSLLHHQINDMILNYNASEDDIAGHLAALLKAVERLNPAVFYLSSRDVGERLSKAFETRGRAAPDEGQIRYWSARKQTDLRVLDGLPAESHIVDVSSEDWDAALDAITNILVKK